MTDPRRRMSAVACFVRPSASSAVGRQDRSVGGSARSLVVGLVLDVADVGELGVRLDPAVDERLDGLRAAQLRADVGAAALRLEVLDQARAAARRRAPLRRRTGGCARSRPRWPRRGPSTPSASATAPSVSSTLTRCSAGSRYSSRSLASSRSVARQVLLVADALLGQADLQLVEHHLDLAIDQQVRELDGRVGRRRTR